ncbi:monofunctional biosynthetic peptidoglycan transglycosylase [Bdellovibrio sp. HCB2-146]|uniref:monofunctional biosynthetic peptidoglycan transglycosylase n=1 Tax=Bdellovibrio sp. HCB2-146 TaxID=3394362 RepID=UPI0039BD023C
MAEKRKWTWWVKTLLLKGVLLFFVLSLGLVLLYRFVPVGLTPLMVIRSVESVWGDKWVGINKDWVPLEDISPSVQRAVLKAEDYKFFEHNGFDYEAIQKAYKYNKTHTKKKGASTISQQTAKNVFLWPNRDWLRKGLEAYFTVLIEFVWPKDRIMEVYLNVIELGPGVYGVEAASQKFFKKSAKNLNAFEASLIAAVLPNPRRFKIDRPSRYVMHRQRRIMYRVAPPIPKADAVLFQFWDLKFESEDEN